MPPVLSCPFRFPIMPRIITKFAKVRCRKRYACKFDGTQDSEHKLASRPTHQEEYDVETVTYPVPAPPPDELRDKIRKATKEKIARELSLREWGDRADLALYFGHRKLPYQEHIKLFVDKSPHVLESPGGPAGGANLLARFDVLAVPARADYNAMWEPLYKDRHRKAFYVLHAAALNVGESLRAPDFQEYSKPFGQLDESKYVDDMGRIFENVLQAAAILKIKHLVWFPFGMGAFLRKLGDLDSKYSGDVAANRHNIGLRRNLCQRFAEAVGKVQSRSFKIYLCIQKPSDVGGEADVNAQAFLSALQEYCLEDVRVCLNADALELTHALAGKQKGTVALLNGANRKLIGNHWFGSGAKKAIDENLHRRSWLLGAFAYLLNDFGSRERLSADTLSQRVAGLAGKLAVHTINE